MLVYNINMCKKPTKKTIAKNLLKQWRIQALQQWHNKCAICNKPHTKLNVHHIISRSVKELKYDIKNSICLCPKHHMFDRHISAHKGSFRFIKWLLSTYPDICSYLDT
jgi:predicted restriction endonuclease